MDAEQLTKVVRERLGRRVASIEGIEAGMGTRRFQRLHFADGEPRTLIARNEPDANAAPTTTPPRRANALDSPRIELPSAPTWLAEPSLEPLRSFLESAGLRVPKSYGHFPEQGLDLLEDVGSRSLLLADARDRPVLYRKACAFVPRLQMLSAPGERIPAFARRYDRALVETKLWKWLHWTIPGLLGRAASPGEVREVGALFRRIADLLEAAPRRLAHRDFKAENLHLLPRATGASGSPTQEPAHAFPELVLIDVQGAFMAPPEYDLVCLLYDLQTDLDEALITRLFAEQVPALPDRPELELARLRFDAIAVTRLCKDVSHVIYAGLARGDRRRWREIPRGLELLGRSARRLEHTFPGVESQFSVIHALTTRLESTDIAGEERAR